MAHLAAIWEFTRGRVRHAYQGLTDEQLAWSCPESGTSIAHLLYHVAGTEYYWGTRIAGLQPGEPEFDERLDAFSKPDFLEQPSPLAEEERCVESIERALAQTYELFRAVVESPPEPGARITIPTPEGEVVNVREGMVRLAQGTASHAGQIWSLRNHPAFPSAA